MKYLSPSQLRKTKINDSMQKIIIIKHGEAVAILMSVKEYESLHRLARLGRDTAAALTQEITTYKKRKRVC